MGLGHHIQEGRMKTSRLLLNLVVGLVLAALVVLVLFAHLSTRVKLDDTGALMEQVDFPPGAWKAGK